MTNDRIRAARSDPRAWALALAGGLIVGLLAGPILGGSPSSRVLAAGSGDDVTKEHTIAVSGTGKIMVAPDTADLRLGVLSQAATVRQARSDAAAAMTQVIKALREAGIAEADIQTTTFSLQPVYDYRNQARPRITGYEIRNGIVATVRDLDQAAPAIDAALSAGATTFDSLDLRVADPTTAERKAREAAVAQAKAKAETLARASGTRITGVASINETVANTPWPYAPYAAGAATDKAATPIQPGTSDVVVTVAVVYIID
ncbi:MAG: SIMPL domain-containing protein [Chloroflexota bacterium]